jgi:hypothetical protein
VWGATGGRNSAQSRVRLCHSRSQGFKSLRPHQTAVGARDSERRLSSVFRPSWRNWERDCFVNSRFRVRPPRAALVVSGRWCNGSTVVSKTADFSSSLDRPARSVVRFACSMDRARPREGRGGGSSPSQIAWGAEADEGLPRTFAKRVQVTLVRVRVSSAPPSGGEGVRQRMEPRTRQRIALLKKAGSLTQRRKGAKVS